MTVALAEGQIWCPQNGDRQRQIDNISVAGVASKYPMGTILVDWSKNMMEEGRCTQRAFRRWIAHTKVVLPCSPP